MAKTKFEQSSTDAALTGVGMAEPENKTGAADEAQTGTELPATGTAGATADVAGADTPAADAGGLTDPAATSALADPAPWTPPLILAGVIDALDHDGTHYGAGDLIHLNEDAFLVLSRAGVVSEI